MILQSLPHGRLRYLPAVIAATFRCCVRTRNDQGGEQQLEFPQLVEKGRAGVCGIEGGGGGAYSLRFMHIVNKNIDGGGVLSLYMAVVV